jgi:tRNA threonylcarbamoyladenosine biosynthesis protein TsaE
MTETVADETGTARVAAALAATLGPGEVVHLVGDLGAGKTTFVRHAAKALGVAEPVTSPTFAVAHRYRGRDGLPVAGMLPPPTVQVRIDDAGDGRRTIAIQRL